MFMQQRLLDRGARNGGWRLEARRPEVVAAVVTGRRPFGHVVKAAFGGRLYPRPVLTATDVTLHHGPLLVLSSVTLAVGPRSRIGLVGPNGIGKSTFLRVLAGIERPESGSVRRDPPSLRVGYLPQEPDARPGEARRAGGARCAG